MPISPFRRLGILYLALVAAILISVEVAAPGTLARPAECPARGPAANEGVRPTRLNVGYITALSSFHCLPCDSATA